jgi:hypothetical protein
VLLLSITPCKCTLELPALVQIIHILCDYVHLKIGF